MKDARYYAEYREKNRAKIAEYTRQYHAAHRKQVQAAKRKWYLANKEKAKAASKHYRDTHKVERRLKRTRTDADYFAYIAKTYGVPKEDMLLLYRTQNGKCAICEKELAPRKMCVDHCHSTKKVRGGLCRNCNVGVGLLGDTAESVFKAYAYLKETSGWVG